MFAGLLTACASDDAAPGTDDSTDRTDAPLSGSSSAVEGGDANEAGDGGSDEVVLPADVGTGTPDGAGDDSTADDAAEHTGTATGGDGTQSGVVDDPPGSDEIRRRSPEAVGDGDPPRGVGTSIVEITDSDGEVCRVCMWHADEGSERSSGLMGVRDLGEPVGMAFAWDAPTSGRFYMFSTPTPLSIAWFSPDGAFLSETDMEPCLDETSANCERYATTGEYTLAIEMFQGELAKVGIGPGSTARVVAVSESDTCPQAVV